MVIKDSVAVILVNYNTVEHTLECIKSIFLSNYEGIIQVVVVDNHSNDNCSNEIKSHYSDDKVHIIENEKNYGFAKANNIGVEWANSQKYDFVLLLNNDTVINQDTIEKLTDCYFRYKEVGIVTGKILNYYQRDVIWYAGGNISHFRGDADIDGFSCRDVGMYDQEKTCSFASGCCMLICTKLASEHKLPEEYFLYYEDVDYCNQILRMGKKIIYTPDALIFHKESVSTKKKSKLYSYYFARNRLLFIQRNLTGINRMISYAYSYMWLIKKIITRELDTIAVLSGIKDYWKGKLGENTTFEIK